MRVSSEVVLAGAVRTAVGKFGRALREIHAQRLGAVVVRESVRRAGLQPSYVEDVIMGNVISSGLGQNPARQAAIYGGLSVAVGAVTINKVCGSGLKAVMLAAQAVKAGDAEVVVAGGMESMSNTPHVVRHIRWGLKYGDNKLVDSMIYDGLWDVYNNFHMGMTGEIIAEKYGITRSESDEFALRSHNLAYEATKRRSFRKEIVGVETLSDEGKKAWFKTDEGIRKDTTLEKLGRLPAVFKEKGTLTAGNSSQLSDGAAAVVVMSREKADELGVKPIGRVVAYATGGVKPEYVMEAPIPTVKSLLKKSGFSIDDMDLVEHNEAYASASIAVARELGVDMKRFNVNGGAIAMGHPIGCSGAKLLVSMLYALKERGGKRGLVTLCLGGGNAVAMIVETL